MTVEKLVRWLPLLRYLVAGLINTLVGYSTFVALFFGLGWGIYPANFASYIAGLTVSFLQLRFWVYRSDHRIIRSVWGFLLSFCLAFGTNILVMFTCHSVLEWPPAYSQGIAMVCYSAIFYLVSRKVMTS